MSDSLCKILCKILADSHSISSHSMNDHWRYLINTFPQDYLGKRMNPISGYDTHMLERALDYEKNRAFLLIDMQEDFLDSIDEFESIDMIDSQIKVIDYCAKNDLPLAMIEYVPILSNMDKTIDMLSIVSDKVKRKETFKKAQGKGSGFTNNYLESWLRENNVDELYLMGINASDCVSATAKDAIDLGFRVVTSGNLIANPRRCGGDKNREYFEKIGIFY